MVKLTQEEFVKRMKKLNYDFSEAKYINARTKVKVICSKHGDFFRTPKELFECKGCPACGKEKSVENLKRNNLQKQKTTKEFIEESKNIFKEQFDYSETNYINAKTKIKLKCNFCGNSFWQNPHTHLSPRGCPYCKQSTGEQIIRNFLKENNVDFEIEYKFEGCKDAKPLPFDFYIPKLNVLVEIQGEQHYKKMGLETRKRFLLRKHHDWLKRKFARDNGIKLISLKASDIKQADLHRLLLR